MGLQDCFLLLLFILSTVYCAFIENALPSGSKRISEERFEAGKTNYQRKQVRRSTTQDNPATEIVQNHLVTKLDNFCRRPKTLKVLI